MVGVGTSSTSSAAPLQGPTPAPHPASSPEVFNQRHADITKPKEYWGPAADAVAAALAAVAKRRFAAIGQQKVPEQREVERIPTNVKEAIVEMKLAEEARRELEAYRAKILDWPLPAATAPAVSASSGGDYHGHININSSSSGSGGCSSSSGNNNSSSSADAFLARSFGPQEGRWVLPAAAVTPTSYLRTKKRDPSIVCRRQSEFAHTYRAREKLLAGEVMEGEEVPEGVAPPVIKHSCTTTGVNGDVFHHVRSDLYGIPYTKTTCIMPYSGYYILYVTLELLLCI